MKRQRRTETDLISALFGAVVLVLTGGIGIPTPAIAGEWSIGLEPMYVSVYGHDQHVMNVHEVEPGPTSTLDRTTAVSLEVESDFAPRIELQYVLENWRFGVDAFYFVPGFDVADQAASASGSGARVTFEVADRSFTSTRPGESLLFHALEDTDVAVWTADLYAMRTVVDREETALRLRLGLRNADFDNDYRAVVGIEEVGGRRVDASSNYGRMMGPLLGISGELNRGKNRVNASLAQSLVFGEAELTNRTRDFTGPLSDAFAVEVDLGTTVSETRFRAEKDVSIPITDLGLDWSYRLGEHFTLGAGVHGSVWWDVPVPPGVAPVEDGAQSLHEDTIVFFGLMGSVKVTL